MIAKGTTHTAEEATVYVCDLDMFCSSSIMDRNTRGTFAWKFVREAVVEVDGI